MKKQGLALVFLVFVVVFSLNFVSAKTLIAGKILNFDSTQAVAGAYVNVTCNGNSVITNSSENGNYAVQYLERECNVGDYLIVYAHHPNYGYGENNEETITDKEDLLYFDMNLGIVDVPLVPEFGLIVGGLTIIGAIGIFFFVRRQ